MCSELTPRAPVPDNRTPQLMQPWAEPLRNLLGDLLTSLPRKTLAVCCALRRILALVLGRAHLGGCAIGQALVKTNAGLLVLLLLANWLLRILSQTLSACPTKVHVQLLQGKNTRLDCSSGIGLAHLTCLCIAV